MPIARSVIAAGVALVAACSGPKFTAKDCAETDCTRPSSGGASNSGGTSSGDGGEAAAGTSTGGTATGGSDGGSNTGGSATGGVATGGASTGGTTSGGANTGGVAAMSGSGGAGNAGSGAAIFPANGILDDFNREGPELGVDWIGGINSYALTDQTLTCEAGYCEGVFWSQEFGVAQEVFATLTAFSNLAEEINLVLKAREGNTNCDLIELFYSPEYERLSVAACWGDDVDPWHILGIVEIALVAGDELGGRVGIDGFIDLYRNRRQIGRFDANAYPFIDLPGRIGVNGIIGLGSESNVWDDFGGGSR